jgi:FKBP-type peptidyl-prolyl cis-trans isomerase FkpA
MNIKSIVAGIIVIIVVIVGGYFIVKSAHTAHSAQSQQSQTQSATSTPTQVQGQDEKVGTGATATPGSVVSVLYVGYLDQVSTSTVFDSSAAHGNQPITFTLGAQGLIPGFQIGINGMKVGGERLIEIPPSLGYGAQDVKDSNGKVIIPANSTLFFAIELVNVQAATSTATTTTAK